MASIIFLLDTDVVSRAGLRNPPPALRPWMRAVGTSSLALCFPVIAELQRGAHLAARNDPGKGERVSVWIDAILSVGFQHAILTPAVAELYARMTTTPGLKKLAEGPERLGCHFAPSRNRPHRVLSDHPQGAGRTGTVCRNSTVMPSPGSNGRNSRFIS